MTALTPTDAAKIEMAREICALITESILAERERCAQIAETCTVKSDWASEIAAAIRNLPFAAPAVPRATTPSSESPEGETRSLSGTNYSEVTA